MLEKKSRFKSTLPTRQVTKTHRQKPLAYFTHFNFVASVLSFVDLKNNAISDKGATAIAEALNSSALTELHLQNNGIDEKGIFIHDCLLIAKNGLTRMLCFATAPTISRRICYGIGDLGILFKVFASVPHFLGVNRSICTHTKI